MIETEIRTGEKRFYDNQEFPRGFGKSGKFTISEDNILSSYGQTLLGLELGNLLPINTEEKQFLKILRNPGKATTKIEKTWLKYIKLARGRKQFFPLNGRSNYREAFLSETFDYDELEEEC